MSEHEDKGRAQRFRNISAMQASCGLPHPGTLQICWTSAAVRAPVWESWHKKKEGKHRKGSKALPTIFTKPGARES